VIQITTSAFSVKFQEPVNAPTHCVSPVAASLFAGLRLPDFDSCSNSAMRVWRMDFSRVMSSESGSRSSSRSGIRMLWMVASMAFKGTLRGYTSLREPRVIHVTSGDLQA
jgi:hypothetical protein